MSTKVLADKMINPFWCKRPDAYLQSQLKQMIDQSLMKVMIKVDIIVIGGDHGGGKLRMTMKVNFHLPEKKMVSCLTQIAAKIEARTSRMKDKFWQAFVHSKIEAIQNCHEIKSKLVLSKEDAKRNFKKRNMDLDSEQRRSTLKLERNSSRLETLQLLLEKPDLSLPTIKFKTTR